MELPASPDTVWRTLIEVYSAFGLTPDVADSRSRTYGVRRFTGTRLGGKRTGEYVRCASEGLGPSAVMGHRTELSIVSVLAPAGNGGTILTTEVTGSATRADGSTAPMPCASTGELELRINEVVRGRLPG
jgi:hypothetical protein